MGFKRGSGDVSQIGNSNQKRKVKTKEELAQLRKQMMKTRFKSGLNNQVLPSNDDKSVADDVSGMGTSNALNQRKGTQFSLDMHSNIEGSSLSPMASGAQLMGRKSQKQLMTMKRADGGDDRSVKLERSKN